MKPKDTVGYDALADLALDLRGAWNHSADALWRQIDAELWHLTHNPWLLLQTVSPRQLDRLLADPAFRGELDSLLQTRRNAELAPAWFQQSQPAEALRCVAYFSLEFMLSEALPIYSGGLGNVAGDQLKAASDLGVPVVGVGLLYGQGYFRQHIDARGAQQALYPHNDPGQLPIQPLRRKNGEWLRLRVALPGFSVWLRAWQARVGRVKLLLLDTNDVANHPLYRGITSELYGGGPELRLQQELLLGIGGWRLLAALGMQPDVCHLNEGHAAFAVLERARSFMQATQQPFAVALAATRPGNLFTSHTAVAAGFDRFDPALVEQYVGRYAERELCISNQELLGLGRVNPVDPTESFNMAYLAIRGSGAVNGVSRLHGAVSRRLFQPLFPRWPEDTVPVGYVTNGVHMPTWDSVSADELWTEFCGKDRWLGSGVNLERDLRRVPSARLWQLRLDARRSFIGYVRERLAGQLAASGESPDTVEAARHVFDPNALTLGFARRFATYKRPNLLLYDAERLLRLLTDQDRPVQLVLAGKAHPADLAGQALIQEWTRFIQRPCVRAHVIFLEDYDMRLSEHLVQGVDVWINTPRRPWEACGTSGMKALVNGGINLSELDGWWAEAYSPAVGWCLGDGREHGMDPSWDGVEANALYEILERQIVPEFYARDPDGIPTDWTARIRESMACLTPRFAATRAVREYTEQHYMPAALAVRRRSAGQGGVARQLLEWQLKLKAHFHGVRFGAVTVRTHDDEHEFEAQVHFAALDPAAVSVELYADGIAGGAPVCRTMTRVAPRADVPAAGIYRVTVAATRPASDYTARVTPYFEGAAVPLEAPDILWQR